MTETMPTSEVLNRAADLIEERGWGQGHTAMYGLARPGPGFDDGTAICLMGALVAAQTGSIASARANDAATYNVVAQCPAGQAVYDYLEDHVLVTNVAELWRWNDRVAQTASEVIEVLRACAVIEASREREDAEVSA